MRWIAVSLTIGTCFAALPAAAQPLCATFEVLGNGARGDYNPFDSSNSTDVFDVRITRNGEGIAAVRFLLLDTSPQANGPGIGAAGPASYEILWLEDTARTVFSAGNEMLTPANGALVQLPGNNGRAVTRFRLRIPRGQPASAGRHVENLSIRYECLGSATRLASSSTQQVAAIPIEVTVPSYVAAYIGGPGQTRGSIEFGEIGPDTSSLSRSLGVTALSTVPYEVTFESERGGRLRQRRNDQEGIAYDMTFAGVDVENGARLTCPATPAPIGRAEPFEVSLRRNDLRDLPAGTYSDTVTLTFQPRDGISTNGCSVAAGDQ